VAREAHPLLGAAAQALAGRLAERGVALHGSGYCDRAEDNLIATVTREQWGRAKADLEAGKGTELASKFLAAYSSSALAVNAFAPLGGRVPLPDGTVVIGETRFEQERSAWARGYKPTLDVIVERPGAPVRLLVESKCIEYLRATDTAFSPAFPAKAAEHLAPEGVATFDEVFADRYAFDPLDAPQLLKHFLAAKRVALEGGCRVILLCVWWEPTDAAAHPVFAAHASAAARLASVLPDADVTLLFATHEQTWSHWHEVGDAALREHVAHLRARYSVSLAP
jgi:hypothetical protein